VILEGINFEHDKAVLLASSMDILDRVAASLVEHPEVKVEVGGHCDADGSDAYNRRLSDRRAKAVRDYLVKKGSARNPDDGQGLWRIPTDRG